MTRKSHMLGLALAVCTMTIGGCKTVTGGGEFISTGGIVFQQIDTTGNWCTFGFNGQTIDSTGAAKGQLQFIDHTLEGGFQIHAALDTSDGFEPADDFFAGYAGTATVSIRGKTIPGDWTVVVTASDPNTLSLYLLESDQPVIFWSGQVVKGRISIH